MPLDRPMPSRVRPALIIDLAPQLRDVCEDWGRPCDGCLGDGCLSWCGGRLLCADCRGDLLLDPPSPVVGR